MSSQNKQRSLSENLGIGLLCLIFGAISLYYNKQLFGWFMLSIGAYGLTTSIFQSSLGYEKASNIGMVPVILTAIIGLHLNYIYKKEINSTSIVTWLIVAISGYSIIFNIFSFIKSKRTRIALKSLGLIFLSISLGVLYYFYIRQFYFLSAFILFFATVYFRQGIGELLSGSSAGDPKIFLISDFITLFTLIIFFTNFRQILFLHLGVITLVLGLFRFSTEQFLFEIASHEKQKIEPSLDNYLSSNIFKTLTATHSSVNMLILPLFLGFIGLSLDQHLGNFGIQSDVFQASIGLLGIIAGFSILILGERVRKNEVGWKKQTYLLNGLVGLTLLFFVIAIVSFIGSVLNSLIQQPSIPSSVEILDGFMKNDQVRLQLLASLMTEFIFFAIPASLLYFFSLSKDLIERFEQTDSKDKTK